MSQATIRGAIATLILAVDGVSICHEYERWASDWGRILSQFKTGSDVINGWTVSRRSTARRQVTLGRQEVAHVFTVRGIYGLDDSAATEQTFQAQVDSLEAVFADMDNETLSGTCETTHPDWGPMNGAVGLQVDVVEPRLFGSILCHVAECRICAVELEDA
jgi:hypothetical protein